MENIINAQDVASVWFMVVFGLVLIAQVYDFAKGVWK